MLRRRDSTSVASDHVSPRSMDPSPSGGSPSLSLVINQRPFRASTAETEEIESPQSETPAIPPRPTPPSHPLPSIYVSPLEEHPPFPSRPPDTVPRSTSQSPQFPQVPQIPVHPSTPIQPIQPAGDFVGGFRVGSPSRLPPRPAAFSRLPSGPLLPSSTMPIPTMPFLQIPGRPPPTPGGFIGEFQAGPPHQHGAGRDRSDSRHNTTGHTNWFNIMPFFRSDSGPSHHKSADVTGGVHARVWPTYNKKSQEFDEKMLARWNYDLDTLLIFAALFSAIVTSFLIRALDDLGPDYQQQSALILHQLLNGRDPSLANISDPTLPFKPSGFAIAVNCLWFASLSASLGASFGAVICKGWFTEYNDGANTAVELIRACQRQVRFMAFQQWNFHFFVALLLPLLHSSVLLFFAGAIIYLWQMDERVAIAYQVIGGIFTISYFISTFLPFIVNAPFRPYWTLLFHRLSVVIGGAIMPIVDVFVHACHLTLRYVVSAILWPFAKMTVGHRALQNWYMKARTVLPGEYKHIRVWWAKAFEDSLDNIDTGPKVQEEAILWLSEMPLTLSESKPVVSSLALIASSRTRRFPKSVTMFLNLTLESLFDEEPSQEVTNASIDCVLVLGHIKFQSMVDLDPDYDYDVAGIPVTPFVAWKAQQLTIDAFQAGSDTSHSEAIRARLLTAAAWLSPMDGDEVEWDGGTKLKIQDRWQFIERIQTVLERHVCDKPLDNKVLINLIRGMHACIPRGDHGIASSTVSFLPILCDDYHSPWSEDEDVLRALITYALDLLLSPARRKPLVEREVEFGKLASELIDALMIKTTYIDVVAFGFWLMYRVPYAFKSRKTLLADIAHIWTSTNDATPENRRERMTFHAVSAFVAVAQFHATAKGKLPRLTSHNALGLLKAALGYDCSQLLATHAIAMVLNLGTSSQVTTFMNGIEAGSFRKMLSDVKSDLERNAVEEDVVDLRIYSVLVLSKFRSVELGAGRAEALIRKMEVAIGDSLVARNSGDEASLDLDRVKWKAIYLSALLFKFVPEGEKEERMDGFRARVRGLLQSGGLPLVGDYEHCLEPLAMGDLELRTPAEQRGPKYRAFEVWVDGFPLFPLAGSVTSVRTQ